MAQKYLIVATKRELKYFLKNFKEEARHRLIIKTGVGATNVIRALRRIPIDADILNFGFAGSIDYPVGKTVSVGWCRTLHPNVTFQEETFPVGDNQNDCLCVTSGDFALDGRTLPPHSIVDMELAYIAAFGFPCLRSIKLITDNLNYEQYVNSVKSCLKK